MRRSSVLPVLLIGMFSLMTAIVVVLVLRDEPPAPPPGASFGRGTLVVLQAPEGDPEPSPSAEVPVEIAATDEARAQGLMGRQALDPGAGMAFVFDEPSESAFWMKDTLIPLRIGFWDADGTIVAVLDMEPCTEDPCPTYPPEAEYIGAIEADASTFEDAGIVEGSTVRLEQA